MVENARGILQRAGWKKAAMFEELYFQPGKSGQPGLANSADP
jgi:hypothetical protein